MKKFLAVICVAVLAVAALVPCTAFANSALKEFRGVSATGVIVTENCPLVVDSELLTFNITDFPQVDESSYDYTSNVVAQYTFRNPSDLDISAKLLFPFGMLPMWVYSDNFDDTARYDITVDGVAVEKQVRYTYGSRYDQIFDWQSSLQQMSDTYLPYGDYTADTVVYKYDCALAMQDGEGNPLNRNGKFVFDFSQYEYDVYAKTDKDYLTRHSNFEKRTQDGTAEITIYSIGGSVDVVSCVSATCYDGTENKWSGVDCGVNITSATQTTFPQLVLDCTYDESMGISRVDWYNVYVAYSKDRSENNIFAIIANDYFDIQYNVVRWYQYTLNVAAGQTVVNTVTAPIYPSVNQRYTPSKFTYSYAVTPASSWADFSDLTVVVNTDTYLLDSSVGKFEKIEGGYTAHFDKLPEQDLQFTLCESKNPSPDTENLWWIAFGIFLLPLMLLGVFNGGWGWIIVVLLLLGKIVCAIVFGVRESRRKKAAAVAPPSNDGGTTL